MAKPSDQILAEEEYALVDLVTRVLDRGVLIQGDVVLSVAGIDLVYVGLQVLLSSVETMRERSGGSGAP